MILLYLIEEIAAVLIIVFLFTQMLWPLINGRATFPAFRKSRVAAIEEREQLLTKNDDLKFRDETRRLRDEAKKAREGKTGG